MKQGELTKWAWLATSGGMNSAGHRRAIIRAWAIATIPMILAGCITVNAPDEPIVIELNVNIRQEVIYRLAEDAGNTIEENADIF